MNTESLTLQHSRLVALDAGISALLPAVDVQDEMKRALQAKLDAAKMDPGDPMEVGAVIAGLEAGLAVVKSRYDNAKKAYEKGRIEMHDLFLAAARQLANTMEDISREHDNAFVKEVQRIHPGWIQGTPEMDYHLRRLGWHNRFCCYTMPIRGIDVQDCSDIDRKKIIDILGVGIKRLSKEANEVPDASLAA